ncbi:MAG: hypothetical protein DMG68_01435 [Acidobacteria bacterium]|jgi:hypothetical protein|nr:MAG: hypothetical protein DMG68_01435 [Acidobacteriota bacterium]
MRKVVLLVLLALCLPIASWANSSNIVFSNTGGNITTGGTKIAPTLSLSNSSLTGFTGFNGVPITGNLGTVSFTTAGLISGSLGGGGTFAAGGSFTITGNGSNGVPNGSLFQGSFSGPVSWAGTFNPLGNHGKGNWTYVLTGTVSGTLNNGAQAGGGTMQFSFDVPNSKLFSKGVRLNGGVTTVTVPEPGTLGLLGTGLFALACMVRRKFSTSV